MERSRDESPARADPRLSNVLLFAAGYYVSGRIGLLFTGPPDYIAAVWPPGGVALVGALFLGRWSFPVVWATVFLFGTLWAASTRVRMSAIFPCISSLTVKLPYIQTLLARHL